MHWTWLVAYFFAGLFGGNAIPHLVSGVTGRAFQTPFADPPGKGLSSSTVNVVWGTANLVVAYGLLAQIGSFDWRALPHVAAFGLGFASIGLFAAHHFGALHGGKTPTAPRQ